MGNVRNVDVILTRLQKFTYINVLFLFLQFKCIILLLLILQARRIENVLKCVRS